MTLSCDFNFFFAYSVHQSHNILCRCFGLFANRPKLQSRNIRDDVKWAKSMWSSDISSLEEIQDQFSFSNSFELWIHALRIVLELRCVFTQENPTIMCSRYTLTFDSRGLDASSRTAWVNTRSHLHGLIQRNVSICSDSMCCKKKSHSPNYSHPPLQDLMTLENWVR